MMLVGRDAECERIDCLLSQARDGAAGVLVLVGQAGVGKTELLRYAQSRAPDMRVLRHAAPKPRRSCRSPASPT